MAFKNERKNGNFSCFEKLDVLSEGLGAMLWSFGTLHAGLEGNVKYFFYQNVFVYFFPIKFFFEFFGRDLD
jgi:hypothetical protein